MGKQLRIKHLLTLAESLGGSWSFKELSGSYSRKNTVAWNTA